MTEDDTRNEQDKITIYEQKKLKWREANRKAYRKRKEKRQQMENDRLYHIDNIECNEPTISGYELKKWKQKRKIDLINKIYELNKLLYFYVSDLNYLQNKKQK